MSNQSSISPTLSEAPSMVQIHEHTNSPIKKNSGGEYAGEALVGSPRSGIGSSPSKHSRAQGRHNLRLAWAKSSNFRNTLNVPHGGSTHSVCSGIHLLNYEGSVVVL
jgi:hypothetical protein